MRALIASGWGALLGLLVVAALAWPFLEACNPKDKGLLDTPTPAPSPTQVPPGDLDANVIPTVITVCCDNQTPTPIELPPWKVASTQILDYYGTQDPADESSIPYELNWGTNTAGDAILDIGNTIDTCAPQTLDLYFQSHDGERYATVPLEVVISCPTTVSDPAGDQSEPAMDCTGVGTATNAAGSTWLLGNSDDFWPVLPTDFYSFYITVYLYDSQGGAVGDITCQSHIKVESTIRNGAATAQNSDCLMDETNGPLFLFDASLMATATQYQTEWGILPTQNGTFSSELCPDALTPFSAGEQPPPCDEAACQQ